MSFLKYCVNKNSNLPLSHAIKACDKLESLNISNILSYYNISNENKIAIGVSGGVDSIALLYMLTSIYEAKNIYVISVNHNVRKNAIFEAQYIEFLSKKLGIQFHIISYEGKNLKNQGEYRNFRYQEMEKYCIEQAISYLFTAHHLNDLIETFFLNLFRGTGSSGLSSIYPVSFLNNSNNTIQIVRPLLHFSKAQIYNYAQEKNLYWVEDYSNSQNIYRRNNIRDFINHAQAQIYNVKDEDIFYKRLFNTIRSLQHSRIIQNTQLYNDLQTVFISESTSKITLNLSKLMSLYEDIILRILYDILSYLGNRMPRFEKIQNLYEFILSQYSYSSHERPKNFGKEVNFVRVSLDLRRNELIFEEV